MTAVEGEHVRRLRLKYPAVCSVCALQLSRGAEALWDGAAKVATCLACADLEDFVAPGIPGASAGAEAEKRAANRVEAARRRYADHAAAVAEAVAPNERLPERGLGPDELTDEPDRWDEGSDDED